MHNNSANELNAPSQFSEQSHDSVPRPQELYVELCKVENLQFAYSQLKDNGRNSGNETLASEAVEQDEAGFLRQLSSDLQARTYQPGSYLHPLPAEGMAQRSELISVRDQLVQVLLKGLLAPIFQRDLPCEPKPQKAIKWIAGVIEGGLTQVYAVNLAECFDVERPARLVDAVKQRIGDREIVDLLGKVLAASDDQTCFRRALLTSVAFDGIDRMLQQVKAIGREGAVSHVKCARFANELIILLDSDPHYDWLLPAVYSRLSEELTQLKSDMGDADVQSVKLAEKGKLQFLGHELHAATDRRGRLRVCYKRISKVDGVEVEDAPLPQQVQPDNARIRSRTILLMAAIASTAVGILLFLLLGQSGSELTPVEGHVTVPGKPSSLAHLKYSRVWLYPDSARGNLYPRVSIGKIREDGKFKVFTDGKEGAPPGWYRVAVLAVEQGAAREQIKVLDPKYADAATSGLSFHVTANAAPGEYDLVLP